MAGADRVLVGVAALGVAGYALMLALFAASGSAALAALGEMLGPTGLMMGDAGAAALLAAAGYAGLAGAMTAVAGAASLAALALTSGRGWASVALVGATVAAPVAMLALAAAVNALALVLRDHGVTVPAPSTAPTVTGLAIAIVTASSWFAAAACLARGLAGPARPRS